MVIQALWHDENGFVVSAELVLVLTIAVLATIVGLSEVAVAINTELNDVSNAVGALNQSYAYTGFFAAGNLIIIDDQPPVRKTKSSVAGSRFDDAVDDCDLNTTCDLVTGTGGISGSEVGGP